MTITCAHPLLQVVLDSRFHCEIHTIKTRHISQSQWNLFKGQELSLGFGNQVS